MKNKKESKKTQGSSNKNNSSKKPFINRELSWLSFNQRVLHQAERKDIPILEKVNFLNITNSNLDEFIMVRFASVIHSATVAPYQKEISGITSLKQYSEVLEGIRGFKEAQESALPAIIKQLQQEKITFIKYKDLNKQERERLDGLFMNKIFPLLTPINYDTTKEFPELKSRENTIVVSLEDRTNKNIQVISFIPLDSSIDKLFYLRGKNGDEHRYITLEELVYGNLDKIFYNKNIIECGMVRVLRQADMELCHDRDVYIVDRMSTTLLARKHSKIIFMDVGKTLSNQLSKLLGKIFDLPKNHIYKRNNSFGIFDYASLTEVRAIRPKMKYEEFTPQYPMELIGEHDLFSAIENDDILLHHPYESYDPVIKFLEHAAEDPGVVAIRQTLYRVSSINSPIIEALCKAANNGKQVSLILEIKARFDEERNISLIEKLKRAGCRLIYGVEELKTHCKFITVIKRTPKGKLKIYSHIGTGNYNDNTSKIYTDISYFTANPRIGYDLITVFNMLSGFSEPDKSINNLYFSPYNLRAKLISCIKNEISRAKKNKPAVISIKVNSISDKDIIDALYEASEAGVKIYIFCRGVCSMKPINKNIVIRSIVGRFLEHSRIYYFFNGGKKDIFISSADLLTRNLDKRFELLVPITNDSSKIKLLNILSMYYGDVYNTYEMNKESGYKKTSTDKKQVNIHEIFMNKAISNYKLKSVPKLAGKNKKE